MTDQSQDTGPLDWRIGIVDKAGRPTPEFQRRWAIQRGNNSLIGTITTGSGAPSGTPSEGQVYVDTSATPNVLYVGHDGSWVTVGVINFTDLADVPHDYTSSGGEIVAVNSGATGLEFKPISAVLDLIDNTQGAILYRNATGWVSLTPGTAGYVLATGGPGANPSWVVQSGGGGGGGDFTKITSITTASSQTSVVFTSIPNTYKEIRVSVYGRSNDTGSPSNELLLQINTDTGSNYMGTYMFSYSGGVSNNSYISTSSIIAGWLTTSAGASGVPGTADIRLVGYADTTFDTTIMSQFAFANDSSTPIQGVSGGTWLNTAVVDELTFTLVSGTSFTDGSIFTLYGIN
jgi:hypothetical protein